MMVRAAVLKMKDPRQIIKDMEKLDEMGEVLNVYVTAKLDFVQLKMGLYICLLALLIPLQNSKFQK